MSERYIRFQGHPINEAPRAIRMEAARTPAVDAATRFRSQLRTWEGAAWALQGRRDASGAEATAPVERSVVALLEEVNTARDLDPMVREALAADIRVLLSKLSTVPAEARARGVTQPPEDDDPVIALNSRTRRWELAQQGSVAVAHADAADLEARAVAELDPREAVGLRRKAQRLRAMLNFTTPRSSAIRPESPATPPTPPGKPVWGRRPVTAPARLMDGFQTKTLWFRRVR